MTVQTFDLARLRRAPRAAVRRSRTAATRVARRTQREHPGVARLAVRGQERARAVRARVRPHAPERPLEQVVFALSRALPDATFVQVGAHDGTQLDPLREAILGSRWTGVMVEPVPYVFERLALRYGDHPRLALENVAIADVDGSLPFHLLRQADTDDEDVWRWYDALGSFRREVVMSHAHLVPDIADRIETIEVPCVTFDTLCERNGLDHVDVVQIDTEGYDLRVLELIDVPRLRPCLVLYEHLHLSDAERAAAEDLMTGHGFTLVSDGMDTLAVDDRALGYPAVAAAFDGARAALRAGPVGVVGRPRQIPHRVREGLLRRGVLVERLSEPDRRFLTALVDDTVPLPPGTAEALRPDHPRLLELSELYAGADPAVRTHSRWSSDRLDPWLDLTRFRGDNAYIWHYREGRRISELKYLVWAQDVRHRDHAGLLDRLEEDGAFGCWTYEFEGLPRLSRDLLDSVGELLFLDASLGVLDGGTPRVLDIGAGYGRLAHRYVTACKDVADYACTDAIATSTFVCEHYLAHRDLGPTARAVPLTSVADLAPGSFDLACNIHSWSECPLDAIGWWLDQLARLDVPHLFVVPNEPEGFASLEADGRQLDYLPVIEAAGYRLVRDEPVFADPAVRAALGVADRYTLFERVR